MEMHFVAGIVPVSVFIASRFPLKNNLRSISRHQINLINVQIDARLNVVNPALYFVRPPIQKTNQRSLGTNLC